VACAEDLGLGADNSGQSISGGNGIRQQVPRQYEAKQPTDRGIGFLDGVILYANSQVSQSNHFSRHVCIFAEGELDRSPTGTGVSARAALAFAKGELAVGQSVNIESILGSVFNVSIQQSCNVKTHTAIIPRVTGTAFVTGKHTFLIDPTDPLKQGFIFR